jgi:nitrite reductase (NO-forming)
VSGNRIAGLGMLALALWLGRFDVARFTVRKAGLSRFIAMCLLAGYAWRLLVFDV